MYPKYSGTFNQAFAQAHNDMGSGNVFTWNNKLYTTDRADGRDLRQERLSTSTHDDWEMEEDSPSNYDFTNNNNNNYDYGYYNNSYSNNDDYRNDEFESINRMKEEIRKENEWRKAENERRKAENERIQRQNERIKKENEKKREKYFEEKDDWIKQNDKWQNTKKQFEPKNTSFYCRYNANETTNNLRIYNYNNKLIESFDATYNFNINDSLNLKNGAFYYATNTHKDIGIYGKYGKFNFGDGCSIYHLNDSYNNNNNNNNNNNDNIPTGIITSKDAMMTIKNCIEGSQRTAKQQTDDAFKFHVFSKNINTNINNNLNMDEKEKENANDKSYYLIYDGKQNELTLYNYNNKEIECFDATSKAVKTNANPIPQQWPNGKYNFSWYNPHSDTANVDSKYGLYGILIFEVSGRSGLGIHAGRHNKGGWKYVTEGCIRTSDYAVKILVNCMKEMRKQRKDHQQYLYLIVKNNQIN